MAEDLAISGTTKEEKYKELLPQVKALIYGETDLIANLSNIMAALKTTMNFLWVGVYLVKEGELVLGPFQGPVACTRIQKGRGVCGVSWQENRVLIVDNVDEFPDHITCSSASKSEIVLPISKNGKVIGILDVDSDKLSDFTESDKKYLQQVVSLIEELI